MGKLHHAMMGTAAVAIGTAAAIPGTCQPWLPAAGGAPATRPARCADAQAAGGRPVDGDQGVMSRSARIIMEGWVRVAARSESGSQNLCALLHDLAVLPVLSAVVRLGPGPLRWGL